VISEEARQWSLVGAFALAATDGIPASDTRRALAAFAEVIRADSLEAWNDAPDRTREEVLSALEDAINQTNGAP
jgi:hypothetical protein